MLPGIHRAGGARGAEAVKTITQISNERVALLAEYAQLEQQAANIYGQCQVLDKGTEAEQQALLAVLNAGQASKLRPLHWVRKLQFRYRVLQLRMGEVAHSAREVGLKLERKGAKKQRID